MAGQVELSPLAQTLLEVVRSIEKGKKRAAIAPSHAMLREVMQEVSNALDDLQAAGEIRVGDTINGLYVKTMQPRGNRGEQLG